jgi:hypothetical protein
MKKILFSFSVLCISASSSFSQAMHPDENQRKFFVGVNFNYGFAALSSSSPWQGNETSITNGTGPNSTQTISAVSKPMDLGMGLQVGLCGGFRFSKNIAAEIVCNYFKGANYGISNSIITPSVPPYQDQITYNASMFKIIPSVRFQLGENKFHPYMKMGVIIGVGAKMTEESYFEQLHEIQEYSGRASWGFLGGLGILYDVTKKLTAFIEVTGNFQNWAPAKSVYTKYDQNGVDQLPNMPLSSKETDYQSQYTTTLVNQNGNWVLPPNSPTPAQKMFLPFSSAGFTIGINYSIGKAFGKESSKYNLN